MINFSAKNPFRGREDIKLIRNARFKPVTFDCGLDLESVWLSYGFCIPSLRGAILPKFNEKSFRGKGDMEQTKTVTDRWKDRWMDRGRPFL